jgi:seryl-tRNA synthetase
VGFVKRTLSKNNMSKKVGYEKRMKERKKIISEIDEIKKKVNDCDRKIKTVQKLLESLKKEKSDLRKQICEAEAKYIKNIKIVGPTKGYEVENGLCGMKRYINIKLTKHLDDDKIRQVLKYLCFFNFLFIFVISYLEFVHNILFGKIIFFLK